MFLMIGRALRLLAAQVGAPALFSGVWRVIRAIIDDNTAAKVAFISAPAPFKPSDKRQPKNPASSSSSSSSSQDGFASVPGLGSEMADWLQREAQVEKE